MAEQRDVPRGVEPVSTAGIAERAVVGEPTTAVDPVTATDLSPAELESTSLRGLIESMARQFEQRYQFTVLASLASDREAPADTLRLVYRVVRELVFNAFKHSQGTRVNVHGQVSDDRVIIEVFDDEAKKLVAWVLSQK